jgi:structural maintenance of chromosome 2
VFALLLHLRAISLFGQAETQYDFSKLDVGQLKDRARELEQQQRGMKKKVNPKVMNMIDTCVLFLP